MLNPFPQLLVFSFFAPTMLRLVAAGVLLYTAYHFWKNRKNTMNISLPIVGKPGVALILIAVAVLTLTSITLILGYGTQYAAILGMAASLKYALYPQRLISIIPISRGTALLLFFICLSLLVTGAGALAMDLPL